MSGRDARTAKCSAARTWWPAGIRKEARGILETKREIKDLRARIDGERDALARLAAETADLEGVITEATQAIAALNAEQHRQEKPIVGLEASCSARRRTRPRSR